MTTSASAFISHASKDNPFVARLRQSLQTHGVTVWADGRELLAGDALETQIQQAITDHAVFFLALSEHTFQSKWVKKELDFAKSFQKRIVVLLLDGQKVGALAWVTEQEPLAISVSTAPGGLQNALSDILAALGLRLPDEAESAFQAPEPPVSELILALETPRLYTEGGVRRGSARGVLRSWPLSRSTRPIGTSRPGPTTCAPPLTCWAASWWPLIFRSPPTPARRSLCSTLTGALGNFRTLIVLDNLESVTPRPPLPTADA